MSENEDALARAKTIHNERVKLRATLLNTIAAGFVIAGVVTPIAASFRDPVPTAAGSLLPAIVWFLLAGSLHYAGTLTLERLR